jgi:hypothetical protein
VLLLTLALAARHRFLRTGIPIPVQLLKFCGVVFTIIAQFLWLNQALREERSSRFRSFALVELALVVGLFVSNVAFSVSSTRYRLQHKAYQEWIRASQLHLALHWLSSALAVLHTPAFNIAHNIVLLPTGVVSFLQLSPAPLLCVTPVTVVKLLIIDQQGEQRTRVLIVYLYTLRGTHESAVCHGMHAP